MQDGRFNIYISRKCINDMQKQKESGCYYFAVNGTHF